MDYRTELRNKHPIDKDYNESNKKPRSQDREVTRLVAKDLKNREKAEQKSASDYEFMVSCVNSRVDDMQSKSSNISSAKVTASVSTLDNLNVLTGD